MTRTLEAASVREQFRSLPERLAQAAGFDQAVAALREGGQATFDGAWGSVCALVAAGVARSLDGPLVLVTPSDDRSEELDEDLGLFLPGRSLRFPAATLGEEQRLDDQSLGDRLRVLKRLVRYESTGGDATDPLVLASIQALLQPVPPRGRMQASSRVLSVGSVIDAEALCRWLVEHGFTGTSAVRLPGEFALRGGILDVYPIDCPAPVRVELFGDEIESLRSFDALTQRSIEPLEECELTVLEAASVTDRGQFLDYLPAQAGILLLEPDLLQRAAEGFEERQDERDLLWQFSEVRERWSRWGLGGVSETATGWVGATCTLPATSVERFSGDISRVRDELEQTAGDDDVYILAINAAEIARLEEILGESRPAREGRLHLLAGRLTSGFRLPQERTMVLTAGELFCRHALRRPGRRRLGRALDSFLDLREGDLVVHLAHGIGRYRGLKMLEKRGLEEEHLEIEFHGGTRVYVPTSRIGMVQKYVGGTRTRPQLARLGGTAWQRQKQAAKTAVADMAAELLDLQAERLSRSGIAYPADSDWQREFDASFAYVETDDQVAAIQAIKRDMESPRPMDRLLCGDVGFGKTELAMRAAFKAVDSGYQVAVLVPTTILAEQHYQTFRERMSEFPIDVGRISRFCSSRDQKEIVERLANGNIDIIIGTHRLASRDVRFHNLGLVIIDEEQRFGVEVKERLKMLRSCVDVLTMTATPIPRTLHMSLVGVRDIANLETPPEDRLAVDTQLTRFDEDVIRHAVLRELNRDGQVYFVHNRVEDIEVLHQKLRRIVPEARMRVGHGQMAEGALEKVMVDFVEKRFDVLIATTIVESGLDIPNANTIFIDEADRYGLADLHQLRGRVGRYKHRAYCYLVVDPAKRVTPNAARRLRAIQEFSQMGAGFSLAMRDLEIRGAGNLLGTQQSGHIATVGYELYCQLLENAVRSLRHLPIQESIEVELDLPGRAFLPPDFVNDMRDKIDLYRRMHRVSSRAELAELRDELQDRFGPLPEDAERFLARAELRLLAAAAGVHSILREDDFLVFRFGNPDHVPPVARRIPRGRMVEGRSLYYPLENGESGDLVDLARSLLRRS